MNYFIEGLQGAGKSTLVQGLNNKYKYSNALVDHTIFSVQISGIRYLRHHYCTLKAR